MRTSRRTPEQDGVAFDLVNLSQVWDQIEAMVPREQISQALTDVVALAGQADEDQVESKAIETAD